MAKFQFFDSLDTSSQQDLEVLFKPNTSTFEVGGTFSSKTVKLNSFESILGNFSSFHPKMKLNFYTAYNVNSKISGYTKSFTNTAGSVFQHYSLTEGNNLSLQNFYDKIVFAATTTEKSKNSIAFLQEFFKGNDTITGSGAGDILRGYDGNDTIIGGGGMKTNGYFTVDSFYGGNGDDRLIGGSNSYNSMWGGAGKDTFQFNSGPLPKDTGEAFTINDFKIGEDKIGIKASEFKVNGTSITKVVVSNSTTNTFGSGANFHFNTSSGELFFAGNKTNVLAGVFGQSSLLPSLAATDFVLVA